MKELSAIIAELQEAIKNLNQINTKDEILIYAPYHFLKRLKEHQQRLFNEPDEAAELFLCGLKIRIGYEEKIIVFKPNNLNQVKKIEI